MKWREETGEKSRRFEGEGRDGRAVEAAMRGRSSMSCRLRPSVVLRGSEMTDSFVGNISWGISESHDPQLNLGGLKCKLYAP